MLAAVDSSMKEVSADDEDDFGSVNCLDKLDTNVTTNREISITDKNLHAIREATKSNKSIGQIETGVPDLTTVLPSYEKDKAASASHSKRDTMGNGNRTSSPMWYAIIFAILAIVSVIIGLLASSFRKLDSTEYGIKYNVHKKQLADAAAAGGLHSGPPGFYFIKFPSTQITIDDEGTCNSSDGLQVYYQVTYQYQMPKEWLLDTILKYRDFDTWATVVESAGTSAVQHACADFQITNFQHQRGLIQSTMERKLRLKLEGPDKDGAGGVYARAISLQLRDVELPYEYKQAVAEKQEAAEDIQLAVNQRAQETTIAQTSLLKAKQQAQKTLDTATNEANVTLTEAKLVAEQTMYEFETEALTLSQVKEALNMTTDGLLTFLSNLLYERASELHVTAGEPAKLSRKDEL